MAPRLVVIGGSAGAVEALRRLVARLPADFPAPILVAVHLARDGESSLGQILDRAGPLPARQAQHGEPLVPGTIVVGRPDRHLVVHDDAVHLSKGPRENRHRPAVDALFNSAARWHGPDVIAVVLSGVLDDGAAGAAAVAAQDGTVIVQEPGDAQCSGMPEAARAAVRRARTAPAEEIAPLLTRLVAGPATSEPPPANDMVTWESENVDSGTVQGRGSAPGVPTAMGCPECQGGMFEAEAPGGVHYLCHVGHSWSPESLLAAQRDATEAALYNAASKTTPPRSCSRKRRCSAGSRSSRARTPRRGRRSTSAPPRTPNGARPNCRT